MKRKSILFVLALALVASLWSANLASADALAVGSTLPDFKLTDTNGQEQSFNALKGKNGAVVIFLSAQCPVVRGYNERINQIAADYASKGIALIGINSNATETPDQVKAHAAEHYKFPVLIDKGNVVADRLGATVTPEAYFFDAKNVLLYHGAIDNSRAGDKITETYLRAAFDASLGGKKIEKTTANAFGCTIKRATEK